MGPSPITEGEPTIGAYGRFPIQRESARVFKDSLSMLSRFLYPHDPRNTIHHRFSGQR